MSYCLNPNCCQPNNQHQGDICSNCGANLLLKGRYRGVKLLSKSQLAAAIEVVDLDPIQLEKIGDDNHRVLKILLTDYPKAIALFQQEAHILGQMNHPGIPKLVANGHFTSSPNCSQQWHYLIITKIPGIDLEQWFQQRHQQPIDERQAKQWLEQILDILTQLHTAQYFHRDIKPANIILQPNGKLALIDFGAARKVTATYLGKVGVQQGVTSIGTPGYIAPEQIDGSALPQSDFFALGRTLVQLLTGKHPQELPKDSATGGIIWRDRVTVSASFADLLDSMMNSAPGKRPVDIAAIENVLHSNPNSGKVPRKILLSALAIVSVPVFWALLGFEDNFNWQLSNNKAIQPLCQNTTCVNRDPIDNKCDLDSQTITSDTGNYAIATNLVKAYRLEMRFSPACQATWTRSEAPSNSTHYIEDEGGKQYGKAIVPVDQWERHYTDMAPGKDIKVRACAKPPQGETKCTNFVEL